MGQQGGGNDKGGMNNMVNRPDNNTTIDNSTAANTQYLEYHYLRRENTLAKKLKHHMEAKNEIFINFRHYDIQALTNNLAILRFSLRILGTCIFDQLD